MTARKKLIEVALPLDKINIASAKEKSIRRGHPSTLHLWWARRPLATCRAVLFASLVDDPSSDPERFPSEKAQEDERRRLFHIIERLVLWENTTNEAVLEEARAEIRRSTGGNPPPVLDPFCGGGSIPLEAQRLGLEAHASDLNPVAVLITKALIEIPPKFADRPPVHPDARRGVGATGVWKGAAGLAEDVRRYGVWMRDEAERRIGHLYPKVRLPKAQGGGEATVIAWLWARTVRCPNPACQAQMPLVRSFALSTKAGKEAWVEPVIDREARTVRFVVRTGRGRAPDPPKVSRGANFRCLVCGQVADDAHVKAEGVAGRMGAQLMAMVAEGQHGRIYLPPDDEHDRIARSAEPPTEGLSEGLSYDPRNIWCTQYGLTRFRDLFTPRQLVALTTYSELVSEAREQVRGDAVTAGLADDGAGLIDGGCGAPSYADAVATYLGLAVSRLADNSSSLTLWSQGRDQLVHTFGRQALPMVWDFAEGNTFSESAGDIGITLGSIVKIVDALPGGVDSRASVDQANASEMAIAASACVSTDPPYYDNISYADLSDFFYVWLRRSLGTVYPGLFSTLLTPKAQETVATPYRFDGSKEKAERHFERGLHAAFGRMRMAAHPDYPVTVYYAFKQAESDDEDGGGRAIASTGWETMLEALLLTGFSIHGTWPMRTERGGRMLSIGSNALASSIVIVCRARDESAPLATRTEFSQALRRELPAAIAKLQQESIAPVDLVL